MIWRPKPNQRVRVHYRKSAAHFPFHGQCGTVIVASQGPGPISALVRFDNGSESAIPRGNLIAIER